MRLVHFSTYGDRYNYNTLIKFVYCILFKVCENQFLTIIQAVCDLVIAIEYLKSYLVVTFMHVYSKIDVTNII